MIYIYIYMLYIYYIYHIYIIYIYIYIYIYNRGVFFYCNIFSKHTHTGHTVFTLTWSFPADFTWSFIQIIHIFAIFIGKNLCWSLFLINLQAYKSAVLLNRCFNTGIFLWILQNLLKKIILKDICQRLLLNFLDSKWKQY